MQTVNNNVKQKMSTVLLLVCCGLGLDFEVGVGGGVELAFSSNGASLLLLLISPP